MSKAELAETIGRPNCSRCQVQVRVHESEEPACCKWLMDNVVCGDKHVEDCPVFEPIKEEK